MKTIPVVGAVIVKQGKILCGQRGPTKTLPGKWELPGAKSEESETPKDALKREIHEELTCTIEIGKQIAVEQFEKQGESIKFIKHMEGFKQLIAYHKEKEEISVDSYQAFDDYSDHLIEKWQTK